MVGRRGANMTYWCALCTDGFKSRDAYEGHFVNCKEQAPPQLPCPVCPFKFPDSLALEMHMIQTGHRAEKFECKCGQTFQTQAKFNQHTKFPSPCHADTSPDRPRRSIVVTQALQAPQMAVPEHGLRGGFVNLDAPGSAKGPNDLPHSDFSGAMISTPTNVTGPYCHDCNKEFTSEAAWQQHLLGCRVSTSRAIEKAMKVKEARSGESLDSTKGAAGTPTKPSKDSTRPMQLDGYDRLRSLLHGHPQSPSAAQATNSVTKPGPEPGLKPATNYATEPGPNSATKPSPKSTPSEAPKIPCGMIAGCNRYFGSKEALEQHRKAVHTSGSVVSSVPPTPPPAQGTFSCNVASCGKTFRSEAGLKQHQQDNHGIGGDKLDLYGRDSWQLAQGVRTQLRNAGLLRPDTGPPPQNLQRLPPQNTQRPPAHVGRGTPLPKIQEPMRQGAVLAPQPSRGHFAATVPPNNAPTGGLGIGGPAEIAQANQLQDNTMRLLMTAEISICHDGKILYNGIAWQRIGVARQEDAVGMLEELVHLPKNLQADFHLSHPKMFAGDFEAANYPASESEHLPKSQGDSPRLKVIVLCCSKILLDNGQEEVVKIAVVDVLTGQPLLDYLVCTDSKQSVRDWRTSTTGLSSFQDIENLRLDKYKVLQGWKAVRAALGKFADSSTIIIGYNFRSDLDALRIVHGRSIDIVKVMEKAAGGGALAKGQIRIEALLRDLPKVQLLPDSKHGRDCLQDAFALRELTLWHLKNKVTTVAYIKKKSLEYQRINGM